MTVYYKHNALLVCFGHSYGHSQGGALQEVNRSRYLKSPHWGWSHEWPKHLGIHYDYNIHVPSYTYVNLLVLPDSFRDLSAGAENY
jgi:hypothetical protein